MPHDEKMLAAVMVKRRTKKKIPFLATGGQGDYMTFICLSGQKFPSTFSFRFDRMCGCFLPLLCDSGPISSHTFQHFLFNFPLNAHADERASISPADGSTNC